MSKLIEEKQQEKIVASPLHDHPLMVACDHAFECYITQLTGLLVKPVQLFYEAALLLDKMIECEEPSIALADRLWTGLVAKVRETFPNNEKPNDWNTLVSGVFYTVAVALSLHPDCFYRVDLRLLLLRTIRKKIPRGDLYEEERVVCALSEQAHELKKWIIDYISEDNGEWLSDVVERVANGNNLEVVCPGFTYTSKTFQKSSMITDLKIDIICQLLCQYRKLPNNNNTPNLFRLLFSGEELDFDLQWNGTGGELRDLFQVLVKKRGAGEKRFQYVSMPKEGYANILCSHFLKTDGSRFRDLNSQKSIKEFEPVVNDCEHFITHHPENCTLLMQNLIWEHGNELEEENYPLKAISATKDGLRITNKHI